MGVGDFLGLRRKRAEELPAEAGESPARTPAFTHPRGETAPLARSTRRASRTKKNTQKDDATPTTLSGGGTPLCLSSTCETYAHDPKNNKENPSRNALEQSDDLYRSAQSSFESDSSSAESDSSRHRHQKQRSATSLTTGSPMREMLQKVDVHLLQAHQMSSAHYENSISHRLELLAFALRPQSGRRKAHHIQQNDCHRNNARSNSQPGSRGQQKQAANAPDRSRKLRDPGLLCSFVAALDFWDRMLLSRSPGEDAYGSTQAPMLMERKLVEKFVGKKRLRELQRQVGVDVERSINFHDIHLNLPESSRADLRSMLLRTTLKALYPPNDLALATSLESSPERNGEPIDFSSERYLARDGRTEKAEGLNPPAVPQQVHYLDYLQGGHQVCLIFLQLIWEENDCTSSTLGADKRGRSVEDEASIVDKAAQMARKFIYNFLFAFHSSICLSIATAMAHDHVVAILQNLEPSTMGAVLIQRSEMLSRSSSLTFPPTSQEFQAPLLHSWTGDGSELHFTLPYFVTLFAHSSTSFEHVLRIYALVLSLGPMITPYLVAALISEKYHRGISFDTDVTNIDFEPVFAKAYEWICCFPPRKLHAQVLEFVCTHRDAKSFLRFSDSSETTLVPDFIESSPLSCLPPFYTPALGKAALAADVSNFALAEEGERRLARKKGSESFAADRQLRAMNTLTENLWRRRAAAMAKEWHIMKDFNRQVARSRGDDLDSPHLLSDQIMRRILRAGGSMFALQWFDWTFPRWQSPVALPSIRFVASQSRARQNGPLSPIERKRQQLQRAMTGAGSAVWAFGRFQTVLRFIFPSTAVASALLGDGPSPSLQCEAGG